MKCNGSKLGCLFESERVKIVDHEKSCLFVLMLPHFENLRKEIDNQKKENEYQTRDIDNLRKEIDNQKKEIDNKTEEIEFQKKEIDTLRKEIESQKKESQKIIEDLHL